MAHEADGGQGDDRAMISKTGGVYDRSKRHGELERTGGLFCGLRLSATKMKNNDDDDDKIQTDNNEKA